MRPHFQLLLRRDPKPPVSIIMNSYEGYSAPVVNTHKRLELMDTLASLKPREICAVVALQVAEKSEAYAINEECD